MESCFFFSNIFKLKKTIGTNDICFKLEQEKSKLLALGKALLLLHLVLFHDIMVSNVGISYILNAKAICCYISKGQEFLLLHNREDKSAKSSKGYVSLPDDLHVSMGHEAEWSDQC